MVDKQADKLIEEVEELLAKATPGEWHNEGQVVADDNSIVVGTESYNWRFVAHVNSDTDEGGDTPPISEEEAAANAELICRARNYLLRRLVEEVKRTRQFGCAHCNCPCTNCGPCGDQQ